MVADITEFWETNTFCCMMQVISCCFFKARTVSFLKTGFAIMCFCIFIAFHFVLVV